MVTSSVRQFWHWLDYVITVKRRDIFITVVVVVFLIIGSQYQVAAQNQARIDSICNARFESATNLHDTLLTVVDLSDLFGTEPIPKGVSIYIDSRTKLVNNQFDAFLARGCP